MPTNATGSSQISILESHILPSLCDGKIHIDVKPTAYIGSGASNVLGAKIKVLNPFGVPVKDYGVAYDIVPPMTGVFDVDIPTQAGDYQYGIYVVVVQMTDSAGKSFEVEKRFKLCSPSNAGKKYGTLDGRTKSICEKGIVSIILNTPPPYGGFVPQSQTTNLTVDYPTASTLPQVSITIPNISLRLFEGVYLIKGDVCATYNYGNHVEVEVLYKVNIKRDVRCGIDECAVLAKLEQIHNQLGEDCTDDQRYITSNLAVDALRLLKTAQLAIQCGEDPTVYIEDLERLLGCKCTNTIENGIPVYNDDTADGTLLIEGCNVTKDVQGLTTTYTINNYEYVIEIPENDGILIVSSTTTDNCVTTTQLTFDIAAAYNKIKTLANTNSTEADFWASIINKPLNLIDVSALGLTTEQWQGMSWPERIAAIISSQGDCCGCDSDVYNMEISSVGSSAHVLFSVHDNPVSTDIYVDSVFVTNILTTNSGSGMTVDIANVATGDKHVITLIPICANGHRGVPFSKTIQFLGCPDVPSPTLESSLIQDVDCPFNLDSLATPPTGYTMEWHKDNTTSLSTLINDTQNVSTGTYYAFNKNSDGCFSLGIKVQVICKKSTSCTAPQNISVVNNTGGGYIVRFDSAAYPPPSNSYTVRRRLASTSDIIGNYTTLPAPTYNSSLNKWQTIDSAAIPGALYVYIAESNCGGSDKPFVSVNFADLDCPEAVFTPTYNSISYSFAPMVGSDITRYRLTLYKKSGLGGRFTVVTFQDKNTPFSNPVTGTFDSSFVTENTDYFVIIEVFAGGYFKVCSTTSMKTPKQVTVNSAVFKVGTSVLAICGRPDVTLYYTGTLGIGTALYTTSSLGFAVDADYIYIVLPDNSVYHLTYGVVGTATGDTC